MGRNIELEKAVSIVNEAIKAERERIEKIANADEQTPILVEGITTEGFEARIMVDPKDMAEFYLRYDYPTWRILEEDAPDEMWEDMGRFLGLKTVCSVGL